MILIKKKTVKIPSFRHKKILNIYDNSFVLKKKKKEVYKKNSIKKYKQFYKMSNYKININFKHISMIATKSFLYDFKPYKKFILCKNFDNKNIIIPGIENLSVGKLIFNEKYIDYKLFFFKGFICFIKNIPDIVDISNIIILNRICYAKSSGTFCKIKKQKKTKKKLILVILPSKTEKLISTTSRAFIGKNTNFKVNEIVEGKFGFSKKKKKKINVRGVAMNPVDHPNGGRTKTVQPERSPWAWVAKKKK